MLSDVGVTGELWGSDDNETFDGDLDLKIAKTWIHVQEYYSCCNLMLEQPL